MNDRNREMFFGGDEDEMAMLTLTDENGNESDAAIVASFEVSELGKEYIVVMPLEQDEEDLQNGQGQVMLLEYQEDADGEPNMSMIEDDEEMEMAAEQFQLMLESGVLEINVNAEEEE